MIAFDAQTSGTENTTTAVSVTHPIAGNSPIAFAGVYNANADDITSVTLNGLSMTLVQKINIPSTTAYISLYEYTNPPSGSFVFTANRTTGTGKFNIFAYSLTSTNPLTQLDNSVTNSANAVSISGSFTVVLNSWVVAMYGTVNTSTGNGAPSSNMRRVDTLSTNYSMMDNAPSAPTMAGTFAATVDGNSGQGRAYIWASVNPLVKGGVAGGEYRYFVVGGGMGRSDKAN